MNVYIPEKFPICKTNAQTLELFLANFNKKGLQRKSESYIFDVIFPNIIFQFTFDSVKIKRENKSSSLDWLFARG